MVGSPASVVDLVGSVGALSPPVSGVSGSVGVQRDVTLVDVFEMGDGGRRLGGGLGGDGRIGEKEVEVEGCGRKLDGGENFEWKEVEKPTQPFTNLQLPPNSHPTTPTSLPSPPSKPTSTPTLDDVTDEDDEDDDEDEDPTCTPSFKNFRYFATSPSSVRESIIHQVRSLLGHRIEADQWGALGCEKEEDEEEDGDRRSGWGVQGGDEDLVTLLNKRRRGATCSKTVPLPILESKPYTSPTTFLAISPLHPSSVLLNGQAGMYLAPPLLRNRSGKPPPSPLLLSSSPSRSSLPPVTSATPPSQPHSESLPSPLDPPRAIMAGGRIRVPMAGRHLKPCLVVGCRVGASSSFPVRGRHGGGAVGRFGWGAVASSPLSGGGWGDEVEVEEEIEEMEEERSGEERGGKVIPIPKIRKPWRRGSWSSSCSSSPASSLSASLNPPTVTFSTHLGGTGVTKKDSTLCCSGVRGEPAGCVLTIGSPSHQHPHTPSPTTFPDVIATPLATSPIFPKDGTRALTLRVSPPLGISSRRRRRVSFNPSVQAYDHNDWLGRLEGHRRRRLESRCRCWMHRTYRGVRRALRVSRPPHPCPTSQRGRRGHGFGGGYEGGGGGRRALSAWTWVAEVGALWVKAVTVVGDQEGGGERGVWDCRDEGRRSGVLGLGGDGEVVNHDVEHKRHKRLQRRWKMQEGGGGGAAVCSALSPSASPPLLNASVHPDAVVTSSSSSSSSSSSQPPTTTPSMTVPSPPSPPPFPPTAMRKPLGCFSWLFACFGGAPLAEDGDDGRPLLEGRRAWYGGVEGEEERAARIFREMRELDEMDEEEG
ncbi:hypothetical protein HDU67_000222, partial [Dinochytrium kinnereticum]